MCGLAGVLAFARTSFEVTSRYLEAMTDSIAVRGPDGSGTWISRDRTVGLGHRRLSILDLSPAANQPMVSASGSHVLVFNGEIYNYAAVRKELEALGRTAWQTDHSDTEVLLQAFQQWGIECLSRLRGMFAFALWDAGRRELWLVRDRMGIKPLYYSVHDGRLVFASEIKALLTDPAQKRALDERAFFDFLSFMVAPAPRTLFEGIRKLEPGTWMRMSAAGEVTHQRYWDVWTHSPSLAGVPEGELVERTRHELREAVQLHKVSDVPVGIFLSGGIDSSANVALFSGAERAPVKTFSIGYAGDTPNYQSELGYARRMAEHAGAQYHDRVLTPEDVIAFLPELARRQDEPISDPVSVPVYYVSKLARDNGVTVAQVGEGADELFIGYPAWKTMLRLQRTLGAVPRPLLRGGVGALGLAGRQRRSYYEFARRAAERQPVFWSGAEAFPETRKRCLLSSRLARSFRDTSSFESLVPIRQRFEAGAHDTSPLSWMSYVDLSFRLPELLLMRVDKMSMTVSLEARVPFLDHKVVEFAMGIPPELKLRGGVLKNILKQAMRGLIPDELIDRKKQGFGVPIYDWLDTALGAELRRRALEFARRTDFFDTAEVERLVAERRGPELWYLTNFAGWFDAFIG